MVIAEAPDITIPKLTNCAAPAKTMADIAMACDTDKPAWIATDPAKIPQGKTEIDKGIMSITP